MSRIKSIWRTVRREGLREAAMEALRQALYPLLGALGLSTMIAWATSTWAWYWQTFSWAGIAFAFLVALLAISLSFYLISIGVDCWRQKNPEGEKNRHSTVDDDSIYVADPLDEALDKQAYNEIVAFSLDQLLPACQAQTELQEAIVRRVCENKTVADFAIEGMRQSYRFNCRIFWDNYIKLASGLTASPGPSIKFEAILDCIFELEREGYKNYCDQAVEIAELGAIDVASDSSLKESWNDWCVKHNALIDAFEPIKRDIRFGKLHRLRPSRWGEKIDLAAPSARLANKGGKYYSSGDKERISELFYQLTEFLNKPLAEIESKSQGLIRYWDGAKNDPRRRHELQNIIKQLDDLRMKSADANRQLNDLFKLHPAYVNLLEQVAPMASVDREKPLGRWQYAVNDFFGAISTYESIYADVDGRAREGLAKMVDPTKEIFRDATARLNSWIHETNQRVEAQQKEIFG